MKRRIKVTAEHIAKGTLGDCRRCPLALALKDAGYKNYCVGRFAIRRFYCYGDYVAPLTKPAQEFVRKFDDRKPVAPRTFVLDLPDHTK